MFQKIREKICANKWNVAVLIGLLLLKFAYYHFVLSSCFTVDTYEYIRVDGFQWLRGVVDQFRLPFYPFIIDLCSVFGAYQLSVLFLFQFVCSALSVIALYFVMRKLTDKPAIYLLTTAFYGMCSTVLDWDKTILTESLSLSLTVFMLFGLVYFIKNNKLRYLAVAVVAAGIGAFTRAIFALYVGLIFGFLILRLIFPGEGSRQQRKSRRCRDAKGLLMAVVPVLLLLGYGVSFFNQYGSFTLSDSSLGQQLAIVLEQGYYKDASDEELKAVADDFLLTQQPVLYQSHIDDMISNVYGDRLTPEQRQEIDTAVKQYLREEDVLDESYIEELKVYYRQLYGVEDMYSFPAFYMARCYMVSHYDRDRIERFIDEAKSENLFNYLVFVIKSSQSSLLSAYKSVKGTMPSRILRIIQTTVAPVVKLTVAHGVLIGMLEMLLFLIVLLKRKYAHWLHLGLSAFILATTVLSLFGTNGEFGRTAITMYPMLLVTVAMWFSRILDHKRLGKKS